MMPVYYYKDLTPRVRARRSFLLLKGDYAAMARAENVHAVLRRLENTRYKPYVTQLLLEEFRVEKAEESLGNAYRDEIRLLMRQLNNKQAIEFFEELDRGMELEAIAAVVKAIILNLNWDMAARAIAPYGAADAATCRSLVESKNIKKTFQLIKEARLEREVEKILQESADPHVQALRAETTIRNYSTIRVWEKLEELQGRDLLCARVLGTLHDITNIMTVLRTKKLGFKPNETEANLLPLYHKLSAETLKRAAATPTVKDALKFFTATYYVGIISPLLASYEATEDLWTLELALKRFHADECERIFILPYFHLGEGLAYLFLRLYEVRDLQTILASKHYGLPPEKIESHLVLHQGLYPL